MSAPTIIRPTEFVLTPNEIRIAQAYRKMDDRAQCETLRMAEWTADKWPRHVPILRLIVGGA